MDTLAVTGRHDLSDTQWAVLEALLPKAKKAGRPSCWTKRQLIDGIRWRVRVGAPWRDIPDRYGSWAAVYGLFRRCPRLELYIQNERPESSGDHRVLRTFDMVDLSTFGRCHRKQVRDLAVAVTTPLGPPQPEIESLARRAMDRIDEDFGSAGAER